MMLSGVRYHGRHTEAVSCRENNLQTEGVDTLEQKASHRVKTLNGFMKWAAQFNDGEYLFRGVSKETYELEASAYRRLPQTDRHPETLLHINQEMLEEARLLGHDEKNGRHLADLELLAELQHFGAATCLLDFTRNALVALWFACQQSAQGPANGKVFAVQSDGPALIEKLMARHLEKEIGHFFTSDAQAEYPVYQWQPKQQNNRILAQQSVFLFGSGEIEIAGECVILNNGKQASLSSLEKAAGMTEASLFPDFDGFARLRAQNKPRHSGTQNQRRCS